LHQSPENGELNMKKMTFNQLLGLMATVGLMVISSATHVLAFDTISIGNTELNAHGFLRNNYGYFLEDQDYANNDDSKLATNRTWLRLNVDYRLSDTFSVYAIGQLVYEPEYDIEEGSVSEEGCEEYSEYDDPDDTIREAYFDWTPTSSHSFRVGRQIVIWGESPTGKIGDVVNPEDGRFTFAFANQEDTRIPQWMVKGLHDFTGIATSFEWLVSPLLTGEEHRVNRTGEFAIPAAGEFVGQRFGIHPEDRFLPPYAVGNDFLHLPVVGPSFSRGWVYSPFAPGSGWVATEIPIVEHQYPEDGMEDARYGFRTSTFLGGYEFGVSYFHTQEYMPVLKRSNETFPSGMPAPAPGTFRKYYLTHPDVDYYGLYFNKDMPVGLLRAEAIYAPDRSFATFDLSEEDAVTERDFYKYMIALDLHGLLYFDWHKSAPINITIEHIGEYIPDNEDIQNGIYADEKDQYNPSIGGRIDTNWFYNALSTEIIFTYSLNSKSGFVMPVVKWTPSFWDRAFSAELRYINLFGDNDYEGLGIFRKKDMVILTTQFNF
jgi:hypothetical protein